MPTSNEREMLSSNEALKELRKINSKHFTQLQLQVDENLNYMC